MGQSRWGILALPAVLAAWACSDAPAGDQGSGADRGGNASSFEAPAVPAPTAPAEVTISPDTRPVTLAFAGDLHFEGSLRGLLADPASALEPVAEHLSAADLTVVNLESAVGTGGTPEPKRFLFQAPPEAFDALAAAGIDVVTMANNHAGDYGLDGLEETLDIVDAGVPLDVVGIGRDAAEAFAPAVHEVDGTTVAVIGASAADDDPTADPTGHLAARADRLGVATTETPDLLVSAVEDARTEADVVVVYLHWGVQGQSCPTDAQADLADLLAGAGADIVVGSHAHRLQGTGMLSDTYVAYGLGNFAWYTQASEATTTTGVLTLTVDDGEVVDESWAPARIGSDGLPDFVTGGEGEQMMNAFADLRDCTNLAPPPAAEQSG